MGWQTHAVGETWDELAPDGSAIRWLVKVRGGSMVHCALSPGQVTQAVTHRTVEEMFFCVAGTGELWRRSIDGRGEGEVVALQPGVALSIPLDVAFQFRATGSEPLELVIATMPPWPGATEAMPVDGPWQASR